MDDSYEIFIDEFKIGKDKLIQFGLDKCIYVDEQKAKDEWEKLKKSIQLNQKVYVRTFGNRDNKDTQKLLIDFYKELYKDLEATTDGTGNYRPRKVLERLTNKRNNKEIVNYQVSHIFGKTKNIYAFTAPWNFVYLPKIMDPLTGHEAQGDLKKRFQYELQRMCYKKYQDLIEDFNDIMNNLAFQNQQLTELRDWLLPMLMNGQVTVNKDKSANSAESIPNEAFDQNGGEL